MNSEMITESLLKRFWAKVNKGESCWLWTAGRGGDGDYGQFDIDGVARLAHRASWLIHHGPIPEGKCVLHNCPNGDNPLCVNPAHLWIGTHQDNATDKMRKGRFVKSPGERHGMSKLRESEVLEIRKLYSPHVVTRKFLARKYGVCKRTIDTIIDGNHWKHI